MLFWVVLTAFFLTQASSFVDAHVNKNKDCPNHCGDVIIKHPFGIGPKCSQDANFAVSCNTSSRKPKPILTKFNLELLETPYILSEESGFGLVVVNYPIFRACAQHNNSTSTSNRTPNEVWSRGPDLSTSPYFISAYKNVFVSVGCDGIASLYNETGYEVSGCSSVCDGAAGEALDGCNGYHCCQSGFSYYANPLKRFRIVARASNGSCRYAFISSIDFLNSSATIASAIPHMVNAPVVLQWDIEGNKLLWIKQQIGMIVALFVGPALSTILISCCCFWSCWLWRTKEARKEAKLRAIYFKGRLEQSSLDREIVEKTKLFTLNQLKKATDNFSADRVLGQGGQGTVYKGMLANGHVIAVKKSRSFEEKQWKQFINEVIVLSQVNHKNVVKLLGCCLDTKIPLLVYEFIPNGTLSQHIHNTTKEFSLTWDMRVRIASEVADAIAYLHSSSSTPIYHRDIKSTNILLDDKSHAKVADFGISRAISTDQTHLTTCVQGTFGYLDPEYFRSSQFTEKSDVYSFGVILVELLTGQEPIRNTTSEEEKSLVQYFLSSIDKISLNEILDPIILRVNAKEEVVIVTNLAKECLKPMGIQRPTMNEVSMELQALRKKSSCTNFTLGETSLEIENKAIK